MFLCVRPSLPYRTTTSSVIGFNIVDVLVELACVLPDNYRQTVTKSFETKIDLRQMKNIFLKATIVSTVRTIVYSS